MIIFFFFFFSSRRRHTRFKCDWSSDVCSSDLDHVFIRFGNDAAFGIVYGTTANPNNIYAVAIKARYLGVAQVVDSQGRTILDNRAIKVYTLYAIKLDSIVVFRDLNGNNVANYARGYNSTTNSFSNYFGRG